MRQPVAIEHAAGKRHRKGGCTGPHLQATSRQARSHRLPHGGAVADPAGVNAAVPQSGKMPGGREAGQHPLRHCHHIGWPAEAEFFQPGSGKHRMPPAPQAEKDLFAKDAATRLKQCALGMEKVQFVLTGSGAPPQPPGRCVARGQHTAIRRHRPKRRGPALRKIALGAAHATLLVTWGESPSMKESTLEKARSQLLWCRVMSSCPRCRSGRS